MRQPVKALRTSRDVAHQHIFRESDTVVTRAAVKTEGRELPPGSEGTIIDVSPVEGHYGVEFLSPFHCIVFMDDADFS